MEMYRELDLDPDFKDIALRAVKTLEGIDTVGEAAKYVPVQYFGVMAGEDAPDYQDGTFIVKKSNIVAIKRYVNSSLRLPVNLSDVERFLGYKTAHVPGLEPADIQKLHQNIHAHALSWTTLEKDTKTLGSQLDNFSDRFLETGTDLVGHLKNTEGYKTLIGTVNTLTEEEMARFAEIPLNRSDTMKIRNLSLYFEVMKNDIENFYEKIRRVKDLAIEFSRKITQELLPAVHSKLDYVERSGGELDARNQEITAQLQVLDEHIAQKQDEYNRLVGYAFSGLVFGPLGVVVTGGIFGSKAEEVRAEKNILLDRRRGLLADMHNANLTKLLNDLGGRLINLQTLMVDAERGAKNLEDVWAIIWVNIGESADRASEIDNVLDLNRLVLDLQAVIGPWKVIRGHASALTKVFNDVAT
ncbi:hypothetical protein PS662_00846 [Pseudomonas fluorescens]|uniref:Alpha-xenorhabdolysin family binary toxin subunit A n=1 Tax=Pseudomonas fluorescens TaxID=294 RepID=A0A5E6Q9B6_PSEFL|nr:alpha-xenorhabdolysin family binary toxin subunit A [Pseudomonas fluorescens]VVM51788.1 hypothetical protein PS662_00846 [Pseudomonas fluorescens]